MSETLVLWKDIISSPREGFGRLENKTKIILPLLILFVLLAGSGLLQIPLVTSEVYSRAMIKIGAAQAEKMGVEMTDEMLEAIEKQQSSPLQRTIVMVSIIVVPIITLLLVMLLETLFLLVACKILKAEITFQLLFKMLIFISLFRVLGTLLNYVFLFLSDWKSALAAVTTTVEYQDALVSEFSLAAFLDRQALGNQLFFAIDYLTNIFMILYYVFCALGLKTVAKISLKQSVIVIIILAVVSMFLGMISTLML